MRPIAFLFLLFSASFAHAQQTVLATANGRNFTVADLSDEGQRVVANQAQVIADERESLLSKLLSDHLLDIEGKTKGMTGDELAVAEKAKVADPSEEQIKAVIDANQAALGSLPPAEARKKVVEYLRRDPEQIALTKYVQSLITKYKPVRGKGVNAADLKPADTILTVGTRVFTDAEFEDKFKLVLYDSKCDIADAVKFNTENAVYLYLTGIEAKARGIDQGDLIAREVTNKLKEFTDEESYGFELAFKKVLFAKYNAKFFIKYPDPVVLTVALGDSPSRGTATAPVTVVMFSDFQCPACSATHPVLQKVLAAYGDKIRFVVRDFPLTTIHDHSFRAAQAAWAAQQQGKFFEYIEILYKNQSALEDADLSKYAAGLGLNVKRFELDLSSETAKTAVRKDMADGNAYGITGTPTIFVNGAVVHRLSEEGFREAIDTALNKK